MEIFNWKSYVYICFLGPFSDSKEQSSSLQHYLSLLAIHRSCWSVLQREPLSNKQARGGWCDTRVARSDSISFLWFSLYRKKRINALTLTHIEKMRSSQGREEKNTANFDWQRLNWPITLKHSSNDKRVMGAQQCRSRNYWGLGVGVGIISYQSVKLIECIINNIKLIDFLGRIANRNNTKRNYMKMMCFF